jgi:hypothetical protein
MSTGHVKQAPQPDVIVSLEAETSLKAIPSSQVQGRTSNNTSIQGETALSDHHENSATIHVGEVGPSPSSDVIAPHPWYLTSLAAAITRGDRSQDQDLQGGVKIEGEDPGYQMTPNPLYDCSIRSTGSNTESSSCRTASNPVITDRSEHVTLRHDAGLMSTNENTTYLAKCLFPSSPRPSFPLSRMILNGKLWTQDNTQGEIMEHSSLMLCTR